MRLLLDVFVFFFFKQKTAYEMRISDWSSDVCSSDLVSDAKWQRLYKAIDRPELATDPRFATMGGRTEHIDTLYSILADEIAKHPTAYWRQIGRASCRERVCQYV